MTFATLGLLEERVRPFNGGPFQTLYALCARLGPNLYVHAHRFEGPKAAVIALEHVLSQVGTQRSLSEVVFEKLNPEHWQCLRGSAKLRA